MDLETFLLSHPKARLANENDNAELCHFFESQQFGGKQLSLSYSRRPDFFKFLRYQAEKFFVFVPNEKDKIRAVGSVCIRKGYWNSELKSIGYLGDLRVLPHRDLIRPWRELLNGVISNSINIDEFDSTQFFLTSIIDDNHLARKVLVSSKNSTYKYTPLTSYKMLNILSKKYFVSPQAPQGYKFSEWPDNEDSTKFLNFLDKHQKTLPFGWQINEEQFNYWALRRDDFDKKSFLFLTDNNGKIIIGASLWSPSKAKKIIVEKSKYGNIWGASLLGLPQAGEDLSISYLTHFSEEFDKSSINTAHRKALRRAFVAQMWKRKKTRFMALLDYPQNKIQSDIKHDYFVDAVPMTLYCVHSMKHSIPQSVIDSAQHGTGFELGLV